MKKNDQYEDFEAGDEEGLKTKARRLATYSTEALRRALPIDRLVIPHAAFATALAALDRGFQLGKEFSVPAGVRVYGPPGTGKTTLLRYFADSLPRFDLIEPGMGVVRIRLPRAPHIGSVVESVLRALQYPFPAVSSTTVGIKRELSIEALRRKGTRLLAVDEAHNLCGASVGAKRESAEGTTVSNYLSELIDEAKVAICLAGGPALERLEERDRYLASRCPTCLELSNFPLNGQWLGLVAAIVKQCDTFDLKFVNQEDQRRPLHDATAGNPRALKTLLIEAVLVAVDAGQKQLDKGVLAIAFQRVNGSKVQMLNPWGK